MTRSRSPLSLARRRQLDRALRRSTDTYLTMVREDPLAFEIPALLAVRAMRRAQELLGRAFELSDIEVFEQPDDDELHFDVTLCGTPIGYLWLPLGGTLTTPADGICPRHWLLWPNCPLFVFHGDWPDLPSTPPEAQEHFSLALCPRDPAVDGLSPRRALCRMISDAGIAEVSDAARVEMLRRVRRRLAVGGDRELCVGYRPALPAHMTTPVRPPRRLRPRRRVENGEISGSYAHRPQNIWWHDALPARSSSAAA